MLERRYNAPHLFINAFDNFINIWNEFPALLALKLPWSGAVVIILFQQRKQNRSARIIIDAFNTLLWKNNSSPSPWDPGTDSFIMR